MSNVGKIAIYRDYGFSVGMIVKVTAKQFQVRRYRSGEKIPSTYVSRVKADAVLAIVDDMDTALARLTASDVARNHYSQRISEARRAEEDAINEQRAAMLAAIRGETP
jgi:hypothetical protein